MSGLEISFEDLMNFINDNFFAIIQSMFVALE